LLAGLAAPAAWLHMPGPQHTGPQPALTAEESQVRENLRSSVTFLGGTLGERHMFRPEPLRRAADWITKTFEAAGYTVESQSYPARSLKLENIIAERRGASHPEEILVVGAHYDSAVHAPGANDNGSGVAALLVLAQAFATRQPERTIRFVAFANEELGFQTEAMGSLVYAKRCRERGERIVGMLSLETMGYYTDAPDSQAFPASFLRWLYPTTGNYVAFIGNMASRPLVSRTIESFRRHTPFPAQGTALPDAIPGVGWSDQWAFWQMGYPALMVSDTAPFRYVHYHTPKDTPDQLNYDAFARVVVGLRSALADLAGPSR
jgi:Zn-dependent M28 family amino/carboxypeptidase